MDLFTGPGRSLQAAESTGSHGLPTPPPPPAGSKPAPLTFINKHPGTQPTYTNLQQTQPPAAADTPAQVCRNKARTGFPVLPLRPPGLVPAPLWASISSPVRWRRCKGLGGVLIFSYCFYLSPGKPVSQVPEPTPPTGLVGHWPSQGQDEAGLRGLAAHSRSAGRGGAQMPAGARGEGWGSGLGRQE